MTLLKDPLDRSGPKSQHCDEMMEMAGHDGITFQAALLTRSDVCERQMLLFIIDPAQYVNAMQIYFVEFVIPLRCETCEVARKAARLATGPRGLNAYVRNS